MNEYTRIAKLLKETYEAELDKEIKKVEENTADMTLEPSDKFKREMNKLIRRMNKPYWKFINTAGKRVACVITALFVLSGATLSVSAVREGLHKFVTSFFSDHTEVSVADEDHFYPQKIEKEYEISQIPDGFQREEHIVNEKKIRNKYFKDDKFIFFEQFTKDFYRTSHDNEYSEYKTGTSNEQNYLVIYSEIDTSYTFIWENGEYVFEICSNLSEFEVLRVCESVC